MDPNLTPSPCGGAAAAMSASTDASPITFTPATASVNCSEPCDLEVLPGEPAPAYEAYSPSSVEGGLHLPASSGAAAACVPGLASAMVHIPPPAQYSVSYEIPPPKADFSAPPPYEVATKLPTYDEVQREKSRQGEICMGVPPPMSHQATAPRQATLPMFLAIDADSRPDDSNDAMLGTDFMFFTAFVVSFLFNWIGFLLLMCFCHTIAARYGALSGFGLSLSKWTLIVKHSTEITDHVWLWWLIMSFGLLICIRAIIQYLNIKRGWRILSGNPHAQERLLFFY